MDNVSDVSDSEFLALIINIVAIAASVHYFNYGRSKKKAKRRFAVRPIYIERTVKGEYTNLFREIKSNKDDQDIFFKYTRMDVPTFERLLALVLSKLTKSCRTSRVISPEARLALTLKYLAHGDSMQTTGWGFRCGKQTVSKIIKETCTALWDVLQPIYLETPNRAKWKDIGNDFYNIWNMPHCIGAIDGKHVCMQKPKNFGSQCFNYKGFHSLNLLGVCDANYFFTYVDIGSYGSNSDGGVLFQSELGLALNCDVLNLPESENLPGTNVTCPYFFVGDEAFPLKPNLMRPYPGANLPRDERIYNYRLSRARRTIENTFGILCSRWRVFRKPIIAEVDTVISIIKACVALHNYVKASHVGGKYCPPKYTDIEKDGKIVYAGDWRKEVTEQCALRRAGRQGTNNSKREVVKIRDTLCAYVNKVYILPWQERHIDKGGERDYKG